MSDRIGHIQDLAAPRAHPYRLIVERPIALIEVAGLLQYIERLSALRQPRTYPARGLLSRELPDRFCRICDEARLVLLPQVTLVLGVRAPVRHKFVAALHHALADLGMVVEDRRIQVVGERADELVEKVEHAPDADAVTVVAPRVVALRLWRRAAGRVRAEARAEGKILDVVAEVDGEPLTGRPRVVLAAVDRNVVVAVVDRQLHGTTPVGHSR